MVHSYIAPEQGLTVLFQAPNGIGLGHISRLAAIAMGFKAFDTKARVPFLIEGASHSLLESLSLPFVSLPHRSQLLQSSSWEAWSEQDRSTCLYQLAMASLLFFRPAVIVFDSIPLMPVVRAAVSLHIPLVVCLRQMKQMQRYFHSFRPYESLFDLVLFPHNEGEIDVPDYLRNKAVSVGEIVRPGEITAVTTRSTCKRVVVSGGGGGYPGTVSFYNLALSALEGIRTHCACDILLITGPLFQEWHELVLVGGIRIVPFEPDMLSSLAAADLIVCQGGYNTVAEVQRLGIETICIPAPRDADDQFERADSASGRQSTFHVLRDPSLESLQAQLVRCLKNGVKRGDTNYISSPGATLAVDAILECLSMLEKRTDAATDVGQRMKPEL